MTTRMRKGEVERSRAWQTVDRSLQTVHWKFVCGREQIPNCFRGLVPIAFNITDVAFFRIGNFRRLFFRFLFDLLLLDLLFLLGFFHWFFLWFEFEFVPGVWVLAVLPDPFGTFLNISKGLEGAEGESIHNVLLEDRFLQFRTSILRRLRGWVWISGRIVIHGLLFFGVLDLHVVTKEVSIDFLFTGDLLLLLDLITSDDITTVVKNLLRSF